MRDIGEPNWLKINKKKTLLNVNKNFVLKNLAKYV